MGTTFGSKTNGATSTSRQPANPSTNGRAETKIVPSSDWLHLRMWSEMFSDLQRGRIAFGNRAFSGTLDREVVAIIEDHLRSAEEMAGKAMRAEYRRVVPDSIREWQKSTLGIGEHLLARLLGAVGHPRIARPHHWEASGESKPIGASPSDKRTLVADPPYERSVSQLWSYCGHGDASRKRKAGMTATEAAQLGSPGAKMLTRLLAESTMKTRKSSLRIVYDETREKYTDLPKGHQHNRALRKVGKDLLKELWVVAAGGSTIKRAIPTQDPPILPQRGGPRPRELQIAIAAPQKAA